MINDLLILLALLILLVEIYRKLRQIWLRHLLSQKMKGKRPRKPPVLRPKSERDCRFCQEDKRNRSPQKRSADTLAVAERQGRAEEESSDGRVLLPE